MKDKEIYDSYPNVSVSMEVRFFLDDSRNRGRFSVMTEKQRMTYNVPGDEYGENSKSSGRQRDLPCDAAGITNKGYSKTTRNAYGEPSPVHPCTSAIVYDPFPSRQTQHQKNSHE